MAQPRCLNPEKDDHRSPSIYHAISRAVDRRFAFGDEEKEKFKIPMRMAENFSGCQVLSYCVMSNHFHILLEVAPMIRAVRLRDGSEVELSPALRAQEERAKELGPGESPADLPEIGIVLEVKEFSRIFERYTYRMNDLSQFMKNLLQRFTRWFNRSQDRPGRLREERFKSVIVQDGTASRTVAAYIDLNRARAGLVEDPAEYRWSSYGEAMGGGKKVRAGLMRALGTSHRQRSASMVKVTSHCSRKIFARPLVSSMILKFSTMSRNPFLPIFSFFSLSISLSIADDKVIGSWFNDEYSMGYVLEADHFHLVKGDGLISVPVNYRDGEFSFPDLGSAGKARSFEYSISDEGLVVSKAPFLENGSMTFLAEVKFKRRSNPLNFSLKPLAFGESPLKKEVIESVKAELNLRMKRDQKLRAEGKYDARGQQEDYKYLKSILLTYGWIDSQKFGSQATRSAFLIAQHSHDLNLRKAVEIEIEKEIQKGRRLQGLYVYLFDRNLILEKGCQRFGTHFIRDEKVIDFLPFEEDGKRVEFWLEKYQLPSFRSRKESLSEKGGLTVRVKKMLFGNS